MSLSVYINTGAGVSFPKHEHNPQVSTSKVNLVTEASVDFDYAKIPLIKTHGKQIVFCIF